MGKVIGIDLGTTNSCVAVLENDQPVVITNAEGSRTTPSVVAFSKNGERLVGETAKRQAAVNVDRTFFSIKREMGSDYRAKVDGKYYSPQEISSMILRKLKKDAEEYLGEMVSDAVITVPAYFSDAQRQATKDAGRIAGLNVLRIINEPTSAALAYGLDHGEPQKILVYDLGGGTFDVSVIEIGDNLIEVLATAGDNHLGGDDFDGRIADYLVMEFLRTERVDLRKDATAMQRVREEAEKAKKVLSSSSSTSINLPFITTVKGEPKHMEMTLTRAKFDELTRDLVERTAGPVQQALSDAGITAAELGRVLLAGVPQIEVTFDIDANGIVQVSAKDLGTGKHQEITITASSNLSDAEIERAIHDAAEYEASDGQRKAYIDARSEADTLIRQVENAYKEKKKTLDSSAKPGNVTEEQAAELQRATQELRNAAGMLL